MYNFNQPVDHNPELTPVSKKTLSAYDLTVGLSADPKEIKDAESISLIDGYLEHNTVGVVYGESGSGKSLLTLSLCVYLLENTIIERINYYDFDNGRVDQKNRGVHELLEKYGEKFNYIGLDKLDDADMTPKQLLDALAKANEGSNVYENQFFVFDTFGELAEGSLGKDEVVRPVMDKLKKLRSMGATIQVIHHNTKAKDDNTFFGSNYIKIKIDALWYLTAKDTTSKTELELALSCEKNRSGTLMDSGFIVNPSEHSLKGVDFTLAAISSDEASMITNIRNILNEDDFVLVTQTELLTELGRSNKDKKTIELLQKYSGKYWNRTVGDKFPKTVSYSTLLDI